MLSTPDPLTDLLQAELLWFRDRFGATDVRFDHLERILEELDKKVDMRCDRILLLLEEKFSGRSE